MITEQTESIKREAIAAAESGKGPDACPYAKDSEAERAWKDVFYSNPSLFLRLFGGTRMNAMEFTLHQLAIAGQYKPETKHMDRSIASAEQIKSKILLILEEGPAISADIGKKIGYQRTTVKTLLRALVAEEKVQMMRGRLATDPATYQLAKTAEP